MQTCYNLFCKIRIILKTYQNQFDKNMLMPTQHESYYWRRDERSNKCSCKVSHQIQRVRRTADLQDTLQPLIDARKQGHTRKNT